MPPDYKMPDLSSPQLVAQEIVRIGMEVNQMHATYETIQENQTKLLDSINKLTIRVYVAGGVLSLVGTVAAFVVGNWDKIRGVL